MREIDRQNPEFSRRTFLKAAAAFGAAVTISSALGPIEVFAKEQPQRKINNSSDVQKESITTTEDRVYNPGEIVKRGYTTNPDVFLTFDDDWRNVPRILEIAQEKQAQITFFPVGQAVNRNKSLWQEVLLAGFTVENHTWDHKNLNKLTSDQVKTEITKQRDLVEGIAYQAGVKSQSGEYYKQVFLRAPGGRSNLNVQAVAKGLDLVIAKWTISSGGTGKLATEDTIYHHVVDRLGNGVIVLQHALVKDVNQLPNIIDETRIQGFQVEKSMRDGIKTSNNPQAS